MGLYQIAVNIATNNLSMGLENIILLIITLGSGIIMAKDFKTGITILFLISGVFWLIFYTYSLNYVGFLSLFFISLVILVFTLYFSARASVEGAII